MQKLAIIKGDGVGPEIISEAIKLIKALNDGFKLEIKIVDFDLSANHYLSTGVAIPKVMLSELQKGFDAIILGPLGDNRISNNEHAKQIIGTLIREFDLFCINHPVKLLNDSLCPLENKSVSDIDFLVVYDGFEESHPAIGGYYNRDRDDEVSIQEIVNTKSGVEKIITFAFEETIRLSRKKVAMADNPSLIGFSHDLWFRTFRRVRRQFPDISASHIPVNKLAHQMIMNPAQFDTIVTNNLYGYMISNLGAALQGGFGVSAVKYTNGENFAMFRPLLGSLEQYADKDYANPISALLCVKYLLDHFDKKKISNFVETAIQKALDSGWVTRDLGGSMGTSEVGDYICSSLMELT